MALRRWLYSLVIWLVCSGTVFAAEPEQITMVFFEGGYAPFYMAGLQEGIFVDFTIAFEQQHPEFHIERIGVSRARVDSLMQEGRAQASGLTNPMFVDPNVVGNYLFSLPMWTSGNYIMMHKDRAFPYTRPEDLFGKKLGVIAGNRNGVFDQYIEAGQIEAVPMKENLLLYRMLSKGGVDAIIANKHVTYYELKQAQMDSAEFVLSDTPVSEFELMTQAQKTQQHFIDTFNAFIDQSRANGLLEQVVKKYLE